MAEKAGLLWPRLPRKLGCRQACQALPGHIFLVSLAKNPVSLARLCQADRVLDRAPDAREIHSDVSESRLEKCLSTSQSPHPDMLIRTSGEDLVTSCYGR